MRCGSQIPGANEDVAPDKVRSARIRMARMDSSHRAIKGGGRIGIKGCGALRVDAGDGAHCPLPTAHK
jgi:hypothetical protein